MNMLKYSNGWGHLIMSIFLTLVGIGMIVAPNMPVSAQGVGIGLILAVQAAWFVPGAAKQVATEVQQAATVASTAATSAAVNSAAATSAAVNAAVTAASVAQTATPVDMEATQKMPAIPKTR